MANKITCPHGIECEYVLHYQTIQGERYVTGGSYWHDSEHRCNGIQDEDY